ncbi:hypothetical protein TDE_2548 [Treponema denticola ATCC 35405]|uniref:Uncharacterized protein n=1 Tax=Treponema denticola (strain ATCC 35405 / DSM 14222 / CIP 103919 / JCM 8153 / KCTC 15104) TaxID=243275 RepID=Q73JZ1_TREDE|nr:hypothetical protein TDE_2548 [Treponema denticola ATCC 35405]
MEPPASVPVNEIQTCYCLKPPASCRELFLRIVFLFALLNTLFWK